MTSALKPSAYKVEQDLKRLSIQGDGLLELDNALLEPVIKDLKNRFPDTELKVLDVGCADGYVTYSRFSSFEGIRILGIDKSEQCILAAREKFQENFAFAQINIEDEFELNETFHLIFCSYVLPHVAYPIKVLQRIWNLIISKGILIVRAGDDGWKVTYPYNDAFETFIKDKECIPGLSDRECGRKIYSYLKQLTPKSDLIKDVFYPETTTGMNKIEKEAFFEKYYGFRRMYLNQALANESNQHNKRQYQKYMELIEIQKQEFSSNDSIFSISLNANFLGYKP